MTDGDVFTLAGRVESALTHFAGLGLAAILEDAGGIRPRLRWTTGLSPQLQVATGGLDESTVAELVLRHATRATEPQSWVQATITHEKRQGTGLFSPRIKAPSSRQAWDQLESARLRAIRQMEEEGRRLDLAMIAGLGEPAYWRFDRDSPRPDHGASRWEMKPRNNGEEFVGNRLSKLATTVAGRNVNDVRAGLTGEAILDELGGGPDSQTSTGLQRPGPVDSALVWCGLWGLSSFPVFHDPHGPSRTPCAFPRHILHSTVAVLPVCERWMAISALRFLLVSSQLDLVAGWIADSDGDPDELDVVAARVWLEEHGVRGFVRFPILKTGSASAPQRIILDGELHPVAPSVPDSGDA